jgi:hypothetical protein
LNKVVVWMRGLQSAWPALRGDSSEQGRDTASLSYGTDRGNNTARFSEEGQVGEKTTVLLLPEHPTTSIQDLSWIVIDKKV